MTPGTEENTAADYGREALTQFRDAARYGARALAERKAMKGASSPGAASQGAASLKEHLPLTGGARTELGELADSALGKMGKKGKLAAKAGVGHRVVDRVVDRLAPDEDGEPEAPEDAVAPDDDDHLFDARTPIPIQESIDVAVPVAAVFDLCTRFEDLPRFSERLDAIEVEDANHLAVAARIGGRQQVLAVEIVGEEPEERLDWEGVEGIEHSGVVTFHPLAPRLTRVELTIERGAEDLRERLLRRVGWPERAVRQELRRFKAYAELWEEANDYKSADFKDPASGPADQEEEEVEPAAKG